jgi:hypothetical protein
MKMLVLIATLFGVLCVAHVTHAQSADTTKPEYGDTRENQPMPRERYRELVAMASCDWADGTYQCEDRNCAGAAVSNERETCYSRALDWIAGLRLGNDIAKSEPAVVFIGLGGVNRIVLLQDKRKAHYRTLGGAHYFWAVFVEEASSPFQTSIDIQFRNRVALDDFEEFDPAGKPDPLGEEATRPVRIGFKRFRVRRTPVDVQVTFSRQGAAYGFRQWVKGFTATGPTKAGWSVGAMVPGRLLRLREFDVEPAVGPSGDPPTDLRIIDKGTSYRAFMVLTKTWPRARDAVREARGGGTAFWKTVLTPEPQLGIGLPQDPLDTIFTGISWPLYRPLRFSLGMTRLRHERLKDGQVVGQRIAFGNDDNTIRTDKVDVEWKFSVGLTIDVVGR